MATVNDGKVIILRYIRQVTNSGRGSAQIIIDALHEANAPTEMIEEVLMQLIDHRTTIQTTRYTLITHRKNINDRMDEFKY